MKPIIIPVASGKGGVGKSSFALSLASALANFGRTLLVDLDLGGANLHTYFKIPATTPGIGDYLVSNRRLTSFVVETPVQNLFFLPGDGRVQFTADLQYSTRLRLFKELREIPVNFIVLDLSAGSSFSTLSFFGLSNTGILVTTPDLPSITNSLAFFRSFLFRLFSSELHAFPEDFKLLTTIFREATSSPKPLYVTDILQRFEEAGRKDALQLLLRICQRVHPRYILNQIETLQDFDLMPRIADTLQIGLSVSAEFYGFLPMDPAIRRATRLQQIFALENRNSPSARLVANSARAAATGWSEIRSSAESQAYYFSLAKKLFA